MRELKSSIAMVKEFHETFGHAIGEEPHVPTIEVLATRLGFIESEMDETRDACSTNDLVEFADGLGDIQYFLDGLFVVTGLHEKKDAIMAEIHRSNMSKSCANELEAVETIAHLGGLGIMDYRREGDVYVVYRLIDGKVMKSKYYSKPDLKPIIDGRD